MNQPAFLPTQNTAVTVVRRLRLASRALRRTVRFDVVLPPGYDAAAPVPYPVLYLNDGQDLRRLHLPATLNALYRHQAVRPFVLVAIQAGVRVQEYGTAAYADYLGRGSRAKHYTEFLLTEMLPYAQARYHVSANPAEVVVAGFSLSGLAAFDFVWHHPEAALRAGAFSGSFWWRRRALDQGYTDADRLMHLLVREGQPAPGQQFWLQTGTLDETNDRNNNGIIDAIEDTLDLVVELKRHGLHPNRDVRYVEVIDGRHNQATWGRILPDFLQWAFGPAEVGKWLTAEELLGRRRVWGSPSRLARHRRRLRPQPATLPPYPNAASLTDFPMQPAIQRPQPGQYPAYFDASYIPRVPVGANPLVQLEQQLREVQQVVGQLTDEQALTNYDPGKWSIKEVLLHVLDSERVFAYRALCFARGEQQTLPGFDQDAYAPEAGANNRPLADILSEYAAVRSATLALFRSFTPAQLDRVGFTASGPVSVRALLFAIPGHEAHHLHILRERYLPLLP